MIHIEGLTRRFGTLTAVDSVSLDVNDGEVFGLLGPNGAGKTTLVRMLACLILPTGGTATINGMDILESRPLIRETIGYLPETPGLYEDLTPVQNLRFFGELHSIEPGELNRRIDSLLEDFGLSSRRDDSVSTFSKGMKQKLAIARAIIHEPSVIFLDEPTSGLDPEAVAMVREVIRGLRAEGRIIFLNTHNLDEAEKLCDRIAIFDSRILATGSPAELSRSLWGEKTVFSLPSGEIGESVLGIIRKIEGVMDASVESDGTGTLLKVVSSSPEKVNPRVARILSEEGIPPAYIREEKHSLEEVYHRILTGGGE